MNETNLDLVLSNFSGTETFGILRTSALCSLRILLLPRVEGGDTDSKQSPYPRHTASSIDLACMSVTEGGYNSSKSTEVEFFVLHLPTECAFTK